MSFCVSYLLIVFQIINYSTEVEYEFVPEDEWFYDKCKDLPETRDVHGLFDTSNLTIHLIEEGLQILGNMTSSWHEIEPSDRIQMTSSVQYFDRGSWVPTILNMLVFDFCAVLYDDKQSWYNSWSSHISNRKEIEKECFMPGTVFIFDNYTANFRFPCGITLRPGRYAIRVLLTAYNRFNIKRPSEICFDIRGSFFKV